MGSGPSQGSGSPGREVESENGFLEAIFVDSSLSRSTAALLTCRFLASTGGFGEGLWGGVLYMVESKVVVVNLVGATGGMAGGGDGGGATCLMMGATRYRLRCTTPRRV